MPLTETVPMTVQADPQDHGQGKFETPGQRSSSQQYQDFFLPISQREKHIKQVLEGEDEPRPPSPVVKKKNGRRRKSNSVDDEDRGDFMLSSIEKRSKKSGLKDDDGTLNREAASTASQDRLEKGRRSSTKLLEGSSEFFVPASQKGREKVERSKGEISPEGAKKRGRPRKNSLDSDRFPLKPSPSGMAEETGKIRAGRPSATGKDCSTSSALPTEGKKYDKSKRRERVTKEGDRGCTQVFASLGTAYCGPPQVLLEDQPAAKAPTSEGQVQVEDCDPPTEGTKVEHGDIRNQEKNSLDNDFFMPLSKRPKRKNEVQEKKRNETQNSPAKSILQGNKEEQHALPRTRSMVGKAQSSPAKAISHSSKDIHSALPGSAVQQFELHLRSDALLAARENARLNAGKKLHPLFIPKVVPMKTSVPGEEAIPENIRQGAPIHVTQCSRQDEKTELAWQFGPPVVDQGSPAEEIFKMEGSGRRLMPHLRFPPLVEDDQRPDWNAPSGDPLEVGVHGAADFGKSVYKGNDIAASLTALHHLLKSMQMPAPASTVMEESSQSNEMSQRDKAEFSIKTLQSRLSWYTARHDNQTSGDTAATSRVSMDSDEDSAAASRNRLWTDLYQPRSSREVCGNATALACLRRWLYNWQQSKKPTKADITNDNSSEDMKVSYFSDKGCFEGDSDSDAENIDKDNATLHKVLLITGPIGCGKSAAVYACAADLGYSVEEVNASQWRNGVAIRERIGPVDAYKLEGGMRLRRNVVMFFEDVDKHFEEDKGFLPILVQLSKETKHPIILTANRREPRLPPVLEKFRIDFRYPTTEELVVHNFLMCIAEGVTCSPQIVESLVNSCKLDLRKVMTALQFWGQGGGSEEKLSVSSSCTGFVHGSNGLGLPDCSNHCISDKLSLSRKKLHGLPQCLKVPLGREYANRDLDPWQVHGRWLFELDVHHHVLPKVCAGNSVCPLSLWVAEAIREAVGSLDEYAARVTANKSEEGALTLQANREAAELTRKAEKKDKFAIRKAFESWTRAEQKRDRKKRLHTSDEDNVVGNLCREICVGTPTRAVDTPTKSLRESKSLARSPLKTKKLTPRRESLLHDSDDDEQQVSGRQGSGIKDGNKSTSDVGPALSNVKAKRALLLPDSDDEQNVFTQSGRSIANGNQGTSTLPGLRPRRNLLLCESSDDEQDPPTETKIDSASDSQQTFIATLTSSGVQPTVAPYQEKAAHVLTEDFNDADASFSQINLSEHAEGVTPETPGEHHSRPNHLDPSKVLTLSENNCDVSISEEKSDCSDAKPGFLVTQETVADDIDVVASSRDQNDRRIIAEANPSFVRDDETLDGLEDRKEQVGQRYYYSGDPQMEKSHVDRREAFIVESSHPRALSLVDTRVSSDVNDVVPMSYSLPGLPCREEAVLNASLEHDATVQSRGAPAETRSDHMESERGVLDCAERAVNRSIDRAGVDGTHSLEAGDQGESASCKFDPVGNAWTRLRSTKEEYRSMMNDAFYKSGDVIASLADLVDVISTSDVMSRLQSKDYEDSGSGLEGTVCKACQGNGGQCYHWDSCEEAACQFVRTGLQVFTAFPPFVKHFNEKLPVLQCILEDGTDPSAIGKCITAHANLTNKLEGGVGMDARFNSSSHADKEARLKDVIYPAVLPRRRVSSAAFAEYSAYLSRMCHLEEVRRTHTVDEERRRPRRFDHRLISKSFSDNGIAELLKLSKYGNA